MNEVKSIRMMKKCEWVAQQTREASQTGFIHIRNGKRTPVWIAYRCYYCGEYFNHAGAEEHFGKSRIEYNETEAEYEEIEVANISLIEPAEQSEFRQKVSGLFMECNADINHSGEIKKENNIRIWRLLDEACDRLAAADKKIERLKQALKE